MSDEPEVTPQDVPNPPPDPTGNPFPPPPGPINTGTNDPPSVESLATDMQRLWNYVEALEQRVSALDGIRNPIESA
jgi:hypothetical protein